MSTSSIARPSKIYPNLDFGLKIYHQATLDVSHVHTACQTLGFLLGVISSSRPTRWCAKLNNWKRCWRRKRKKKNVGVVVKQLDSAEL
jgi:hypothetical protein